VTAYTFYITDILRMCVFNRTDCRLLYDAARYLTALVIVLATHIPAFYEKKNN